MIALLFGSSQRRYIATGAKCPLETSNADVLSIVTVTLVFLYEMVGGLRVCGNTAAS